MTDDLWEILIAGLFANVHFKLKKVKVIFMSDYKPPEFEESLRTYTTDEFGNSVMRGLTLEETILVSEISSKNSDIQDGRKFFLGLPLSKSARKASVGVN